MRPSPLRLPLAWCLGVVLAAPLAAPGRADSLPAAPEPAEDPERPGRGIERTMHLLAASTPEHRNTVRILFYGQSITEQGWWRQVADDLRRRFPDAHLVIENRAIGGFSAERLVLPAEHDIFAFYPDLIIFHVYGDHRKYESLLRSIRSRTAAEVLIQTDHITKWPPAVISKGGDHGAWWDDQMNRVILPGFARKYGCGLVDIHSDWLRYLRTNHLEPSALLLDDVHLNPLGCDLMARLVERYLVVRPGPEPTGATNLTMTETVGLGLNWSAGRLVTRFAGNRVDLVGGPNEPGRTLQVLVDGRKPSDFPELYAITRPEPKPWSDLTLIRVDHDKPLVVEDWTLTVDSYRAEAPNQPASWTFHVVGSKTGADGAGTNHSSFVSPSGRVRIEPNAWFATKPVAPGYEIRWSVEPQFTDVYRAPAESDPRATPATTLFQGLPNGPHLLELVAGPEGPPSVLALVAYLPPYAPWDPAFIGLLVAAGVVLAVAGAWWLTRRFVVGTRLGDRLARSLPRRRPAPGGPEAGAAT